MKKVNAEKAIQEIAMRERITVEEVRKEMKKAMLIGLCSQDPSVQEKWKRIPCKGEVPTPEELIAYMVENVKECFF